METEPECFGCKRYYLYYSRKKQSYVITDYSLEAFDNLSWIDLRDEPEKISDLIKLLQEHESLLKKHQANLSAQEPKIVNIKDYKSKEMKEAEERFYHLSDHLFPENSNKKDPTPEEDA